MANVDTYLALIPSANADKPKFRALVAARVQPWVDLINFLESLPQKFDLDIASGEQLDFVGQWVGISRAVRVPLAPTFFSWDDPENVEVTGWNVGIWRLPFAPLIGVTLLPDDIYRLLLRAKIALNKWDGSLKQLSEVFTVLFAPATVEITDGLDMSVSVSVTGTPSSALFKQIVENGYLPLKPAGVSIEYTFS